MEFLPPKLQEYIENHTRDEGDVLKALERETFQKTLMPQMVSGHVQGQSLRMLSMMVQPRNILEIGTFTGYSALCLVDGLQAGGKLITIDINDELEPMVRKYIKLAGKEDAIDYRLGDATEIIPKLNMEFDMVFIDADKTNYSNYYDLVWDKVRPGGYILADNVLWSGKVIDPMPGDKDTAAIIAFNEKIHADTRNEHVLFPVRDGYMVIRKK